MTDEENHVDCPACDGKGGHTDYFGEYNECHYCKETGKAAPENVEKFRTQIEEEEKAICDQMGDMADFITNLEANETEEEKQRWKDAAHGGLSF